MSARPLLAIAALGLLFFAPLAIHPRQTLYSDTSDLVTLHLPSRIFLARSLHETGELPLWSPFNFGGMPFIHDPQVAAFYPPHWLLLWLSPDAQGAAMSWLVALHVIAAGLTMNAYARHRALGELGALVAALGYMFGGKWMLHLLAGGHYNMIPLAWLPLVLLFLEQAITGRGWLNVIPAAVFFAFIILGAYPYLTLYSGIFIAAWTFCAARGRGVNAGLPQGPGPSVSPSPPSSLPETEGRMGPWLCFGAITALLAAALAAIQLWPSLEAAQYASRSSGIAVSANMVLDGLRSLVGLVGPPLTDEPNAWENRAAVGIPWLALALCGMALGRATRRGELYVTIALIIFALGGSAMVQWLPGFRLFRLPSRMFLIAAVPLALWSGRAAQALLDDEKARALFRKVLIKVTQYVVVLVVVFGIVLYLSRHDVAVRFHLYWPITLLISVPALVWLTGKRTLAIPHRALLVFILSLDLWALSWQLVRTRPQGELYAPSESVRCLHAHADALGRVLDFNPTTASANDTPLWPGLPAVAGVQPVRGFNPIDVKRYKEFLQFIADDDKPLGTIDQMYTGPLLGTFPIKNQPLADLLGIRYLLQPETLSLDATVPAAHAAQDWQLAATDPRPSSFNFVSVAPGGRDCGFHELPPYGIYENRTVMPRAFTVPEADNLPSQNVLSALKETDFRRRVLLENYRPVDPRSELGHTGFDRAVAILAYEPNKVKLSVGPGAAGYLVLTDVWFPGWTCEIDGRPTAIYRANYLFRGIELPADAKEVEFRFEPASYRWGRLISLLTASGTLFLVVCGVCGAFAISLRKGRQPSDLRTDDSSPTTMFPGKTVATIAVGVITLVALFYASGYLPAIDLQDFVEYWAAGRLNARGQNPYDPTGLHQCERLVSPHLTEAIMMWNPPWTLSIAMPFGLLPVRLAHWLWLTLQALVIAWSALWIWSRYNGSVRRRWEAPAIAAAFAPTWFVLYMGQISPLILLGVVGFLHFQERRKDAWAGASLVLAALKPHLLIPFAAAVLLWVLYRRRWRVLLGSVMAVTALSIGPLLTNPAVFAEYWRTLGQTPPQMLSPTVGSLLRLLFGSQYFRLQFVPVLLGLVWLLIRWHRDRQSWDWIAQAPGLLLASFLTAPYGGWPFDLVVLLLPVLQAAIAAGRRGPGAVLFGVVALLGFDLMALLMRDVHYSKYYWYAWMTPFVIYVCWSLNRDRHIHKDATNGKEQIAGVRLGAPACLVLSVLCTLAVRIGA
jgi:hypothetical protein